MSKINYWLVKPGEENSQPIRITTTPTSKVPEVGEVIFFDIDNYQGDFVVVEIKRIVKKVGYELETFEVYIQSFRNTELTETPIAKVRNLLSPILSSFQMLELIKAHPDKEKQIIELIVGQLDVANESIVKLRELIGDSKLWK
jgi:hypothetical protein